MKKRLLCLMLLCSMVLSMLPVPVLAEDAESEAFVCICDTACTESSRNPDCPVCGTPGAHLHDCALYEDAHEPEVEDEEPFEEEEPEEEEEPSEEDPTEEPENPEQPQDESENEGEDGEPEDEEGLDNAVDTLELTGEDMIRVYSGAVLSSSGTDPRSGVVFTLTANSYTCSRGHAGDVTKIRITDVDTRSWDEDKSVTIRFELYVRCYVSGCY